MTAAGTHSPSDYRLFYLDDGKLADRSELIAGSNDPKALQLAWTKSRKGRLPKAWVLRDGRESGLPVE